ncbi:ABC transporter ATP-binding protein [Aeromicrobium sp. Leaf350]|uniref:ABC transporter ATP-binding protein n=1 Tax=Aeromicrobium sp. Leaf350 TaxID=2876565 RepID=UPI001E5E59BB|nr:ABC transporter ATP-binding protein [Aeromicrobium sp. Leaf350]
MTDLVIDVEGLVKHYGSTHALDGLDLRVEAGTIAGFLGPNGAGKSTTIRVLLGLHRATAGRARLFGRDPFADAVDLHRRLAYVPGDVTLWPRLTGGEIVDLLLGMRGVRSAPRREEMLQRFELDPTRRASTYSKGNRQKVALVAAFAADTDLLVLDEPTSGLDPLMEAQFQRCTQEAADRGTTVLLSSHILAEVQELCDTVTIVRAGRTVLAGRLDELRSVTRSRLVATIASGAEGLGEVEGVHDLEVDGDRVTCTIDDAVTAEVVAAVARLRPTALTVEPPSLEELFLRQYGSDVLDQGA